MSASSPAMTLRAMTILFTPSICPHIEPEASRTRMVLGRSACWAGAARGRQARVRRATRKARIGALSFCWVEKVTESADATADAQIHIGGISAAFPLDRGGGAGAGRRHVTRACPSFGTDTLGADRGALPHRPDRGGPVRQGPR